MATTHELSTLGHVIKPAYEGQPNTNAFTDAEKTKLAGIEPEATRNDTDAQLRNRATHTGTQTAATIIDLPDLLATKVDAVPGKSLTDANFTAAEKAKLAGLEDAHFKGVHVGLSGLQDAHPTRQAGDYAVVDDGVDLTWYQWDGSAWTARVGESAEVTPAQVKSYYESNPDTNAFTNAYKAYIDGVVGSNRFTWRRRGTWNAATNTPALLDGTGTHGDFYVATTAGTHNFGNGAYSFVVGDFVLFEGGTWKALPMATRSTTWESVTGKPDFDATYARKSPGLLTPAIPASYCWSGNVISAPSGVNTDYPITSNNFDYFSVVSDGKLIIPSGFSRFKVQSNINFDTNGNGYRSVVIRHNTSVISNSIVNAVSGAQTPVVNITGPRSCVAGDEISIRVTQNSGSTINVQNNGWVYLELFETA